MVDRLAAKANKIKADEEASTSRNASTTSRDDPLNSTSEEGPVTLRQSGYGIYCHVCTVESTDKVRESSPISAEAKRVSGHDPRHKLDTQELESNHVGKEPDRPAVEHIRPDHGSNSLEVESTLPEVEPTIPEIIRRPSSPRPPSSYRYTIPVVQGKDLYKIIIGSKITTVPTTRVRAKPVPNSHSKIPLPMSETSEAGEAHNADRLFKLQKSKRFSLEHVRDRKIQEPTNLMSNVVLTYCTKSPAIQPLPLSKHDKNIRPLDLTKKTSSTECSGHGEVVRRRMLRSSYKGEQDEIKNRRRTVHIMDGEQMKPATQEKQNSELLSDSSAANPLIADGVKRRVHARTRPRSWVQPSANRNLITSSKIAILKLTHRKS